MDEVQQYERYLRERITALRSQKGVSEHRLSLELGKSGSYIRSITSGATMPSMKELFNIMAYFEVSPAEFFAGLQGTNTLRAALTGNPPYRKTYAFVIHPINSDTFSRSSSLSSRSFSVSAARRVFVPCRPEKNSAGLTSK